MFVFVQLKMASKQEKNVSHLFSVLTVNVQYIVFAFCLLLALDFFCANDLYVRRVPLHCCQVGKVGFF